MLRGSLVPEPEAAPAEVAGAPRARTFALILFVAIAYYVTGRLGLLLAIPPGYATAVWPPSGIALASLLLCGNRAWPGIWLGSFMINVWTQLDVSSATNLLDSMQLPALIACGGTIQALLGASLIRRFVGYRNILEQELEVVRLLALGGPVACVVASSIGVGSLWATGAIDGNVVLFNWWTWWVGDSIGVLIFTPVILVWAVRPFRTWLRRQLATTLPLILLFALVVAVFVNTSEREQNSLRADFEAAANQAAQQLRTDIDRYEVALSATAGLFSSSENVTPAEFNNFADGMLRQLNGLFAISWNAVVPDAQREAFEAQMRAEGFADFRVLEQNSSGQLVPSARSDTHVVITYIRIAGAAKGAQGLDITFDPVRRAALRRATETRSSTASEPVRLIGDVTDSQGVMLMLPVFRDGDDLLGYSTLVIRYDQLIRQMLDGMGDSGVQLRVIDRAAASQRQQMFGASVMASPDDLNYAVPIDIGQRQWELQFVLPASYLVAHRSWEAWIVLAGGLLLSALLGILLLVLVGRAAKIEGSVAERTLQLRASEERFRGLVESAPDAMVIVGAHGRIDLVNSQTEKLFGYSRVELVGQSVEILIPERFHDMHAGFRSGYASAPRPRPMGEGRSLFGRRKDGSEFPLEISLSPLKVGNEVIITSTIRDITARKQAEAELNRTLSVLTATEERFRGLVESAPDAMVIVGSQGRIDLVNSQTEKLFGYSRVELVGQSVEILIPERFHDMHAGFRSGYTSAPRPRPMGEGRALFGRRKDGSEFPLEISLSPLKVGNEVIITSTIRDITSRKQAEAELNRTLSVLTATLESTADGILVVDLSGRIVSYNQQFIEMWQVPEVLAQTRDEKLVLAAVLPQLRDAEGFSSKVRGLYADPVSEASDFIEFKDGKVFARYSRGHRVDGEIVGRVWSFRDVTQQRSAEAALKASEARYRAAEQTQRAIVAGVIDAIITIDGKGVVQSFNPAAERMFGWQAREIIGRDVRVLAPPMLRDQLDFEKSEFADIVGLRRESMGLRRDGTEFPIDLAVNRMPHPDRREYVAMVSDISERKSAQAHIQHLAHHDALTKLPNRALLQDRLNMAIATADRQKRTLGVMMLDLDHFKRINDSLGHQLGDQLLVGVADRLRDCVRRTDTVARMGGDEFVVLLTDANGRGDIERIADGIVRQLSLPMMLGKQELVITPSIGVCTYPEDGRDALTLLKNADTAMYHAKEHGRGHYQWFSQDMLRAPQEHLALTNALHRALERDEFSLHYQPLVSISDGEVVGVEALLRWTHPTRGPQAPSSFIYLAEESGVIAPIGEWVLRKACHDVRRLQDRLGHPLELSVNVSPRQFRQQDIVKIVRQALDDSGLDAENLTLEITESLLLESREDTVAQLRRLRELGISVAVDDFGTGYSSLSYLTRFPIDKLKIDGSFVRDINEDSDDAAVISAIIAMGKSLRMTVVAEGVETLDQIRYLSERGCDEIQGFYLSKGVTVDQLPDVERQIREKHAKLIRLPELDAANRPAGTERLRA